MSTSRVIIPLDTFPRALVVLQASVSGPGKIPRIILTDPKGNWSTGSLVRDSLSHIQRIALLFSHFGWKETVQKGPLMLTHQGHDVQTIEFNPQDFAKQEVVQTAQAIDALSAGFLCPIQLTFLSAYAMQVGGHLATLTAGPRVKSTTLTAYTMRIDGSQKSFQRVSDISSITDNVFKLFYSLEQLILDSNLNMFEPLQTITSELLINVGALQAELIGQPEARQTAANELLSLLEVMATCLNYPTALLPLLQRPLYTRDANRLVFHPRLALLSQHWAKGLSYYVHFWMKQCGNMKNLSGTLGELENLEQNVLNWQQAVNQAWNVVTTPPILASGQFKIAINTPLPETCQALRIAMRQIHETFSPQLKNFPLLNFPRIFYTNQVLDSLMHLESYRRDLLERHHQIAYLTLSAAETVSETTNSSFFTPADLWMITLFKNYCSFLDLTSFFKLMIRVHALHVAVRERLKAKEFGNEDETTLFHLKCFKKGIPPTAPAPLHAFLDYLSLFLHMTDWTSYALTPCGNTSTLGEKEAAWMQTLRTLGLELLPIALKFLEQRHTPVLRRIKNIERLFRSSQDVHTLAIPFLREVEALESQAHDLPPEDKTVVLEHVSRPFYLLHLPLIRLALHQRSEAASSFGPPHKVCFTSIKPPAAS